MAANDNDGDETPAVLKKAGRALCQMAAKKGEQQIWSTGVAIGSAALSASGAILAGSSSLLATAVMASPVVSVKCVQKMYETTKQLSPRERKARVAARWGGYVGVSTGTAAAVAPWIFLPCPFMFPPLASLAGVVGGGVVAGVGIMVGLPFGSAILGSTLVYYVAKS